MATRGRGLNHLTEEQVRDLKLLARGEIFRGPAGAVRALGVSARRAGAEEPAIVAVGDSWFDFPIGLDLLDLLSLRHGRRLVRFARAGDTLENMVYGASLRNAHTRREPSISTVLAAVAQHRPPVLLVSGGGNDVAGDAFDSYLNHADSGLPALREEYARFMLHETFPRAINHLIGRVREASARTVVVMHGYARAAPTGIGVDLLFWTFAGPWLKPALMRKNITASSEQRRLVRHMIDGFNDMLARIARQRPREFRYVDLRPVVKNGDWRDELHLKNEAYARCAAKLDAAIRSAEGERALR